MVFSLGVRRNIGTAAGWLFIANLVVVDAANAQPVDVQEQKAAASESAEAEQYRLDWHYPRFRLWQYISNGTVSLLNIYVETIQANARTERWQGPILFDGAARDWLRADSQSGRNRADLISDFMWYGGQYFPFIDGIVAPLVGDNLNTDVAWQLTMINWQVVGFSAIVTRATHLWGGRARPDHTGCSDAPDSDFPCDGGASFLSGHTSMTAAAAGATCAHHLALPLWGHPAADAAACAVMVADGIAVGILRLQADRHWASDVIAGFFTGAAIGFSAPWLLHYQFDLSNETESSGLPRRFAVLPWASEDVFGIRAIGEL